MIKNQSQNNNSNFASPEVKRAELEVSRIFWQYLKRIVSENFPALAVQDSKLLQQRLQIFLLAGVAIATERANDTSRSNRERQAYRIMSYELIKALERLTKWQRAKHL